MFFTQGTQGEMKRKRRSTGSTWAFGVSRRSGPDIRSVVRGQCGLQIRGVEKHMSSDACDRKIVAIWGKGGRKLTRIYRYGLEICEEDDGHVNTWKHNESERLSGNSSKCVNTGIRAHVKLWWREENSWVLHLDA